MRVVTEPEFAAAIREALQWVNVRGVVGPGRSGAIASVYASHILKVPYLPYGCACPEQLRPLLIVDTASQTGATLRKAERKYETGGKCVVVCVFNEPPRVKFWYEVDTT